MKIKWGITIFNLNECKTPEEMSKAITDTPAIYFNTVKECFEYLGFKLPRVGHGYVGTKYIPGIHQTIEYMILKYRA